MQFERIKLEYDRSVAILRLSDPKVLNAVTEQMFDELAKALELVTAPERGVRCLLVTGEGRAFCAGADLSQPTMLATPRERLFTGGIDLERHVHTVLRRLRDLPFPLVTAVNGAAAGFGMSLALFGDMILVARSAIFIQAFRRVGISPDGGSTWLLPRLVGLARAKEISLMGGRLDAEKALDWGLVNRVYDDDKLWDEALALAHELADGPTVALAAIRKLYWESTDRTFLQQLDLERELQGECKYHPDFREGVEAFREKREARFTGK